MNNGSIGIAEVTNIHGRIEFDHGHMADTNGLIDTVSSDFTVELNYNSQHHGVEITRNRITASVMM